MHPIQAFQLEDPLFIYNQQYIGWCGPLLQTIQPLDTSKVNERSDEKNPSLSTIIRKDVDVIIFWTLRLEDWMTRLLLGASYGLMHLSYAQEELEEESGLFHQKRQKRERSSLL